MRRGIIYFSYYKAIVVNEFNVQILLDLIKNIDTFSLKEKCTEFM
jgi:hypothetical protein